MFVQSDLLSHKDCLKKEEIPRPDKEVVTLMLPENFKMVRSFINRSDLPYQDKLIYNNVQFKV